MVAALVILAVVSAAVVWCLLTRHNTLHNPASYSEPDMPEFGDDIGLDHEFTNPLAGDQTLMDGESGSDLNVSPDEGL